MNANATIPIRVNALIISGMAASVVSGAIDDKRSSTGTKTAFASTVTTENVTTK